MLDLERLVRESGKPHRIIAAAADCTEATLNRILKGRVQICKLDTLESIAAASGIRGHAGQEGGLAVVGIRRVAAITCLAS